jgi:GntR family transcriptional regulator, rspAB operon transcriptional repressor
MVDFQTLSTKGIAEEVYDILRGKILSCELLPGQRLDVAEISNLLSVSRTPVKDALQKLSVQDLVEIHPRRGTFVSRITPEVVRETFEVREALEAQACELIAGRLTPESIATMRDLNRRMFLPDMQFTDHVVLDSEFHLTIIRASANGRLLKFYSELGAHIQIARVHYRSTHWRTHDITTSAEHTAVIDALAEGRGEDARRAIQKHIRGTMDRLIFGVLHPTEDRA